MRWLSLIIGASDKRCEPFDSPRATRATSAPNARWDWRLAAIFDKSGPISGSLHAAAALSVAVPPASSEASAWRRTDGTQCSCELAFVRWAAFQCGVDLFVEALAGDLADEIRASDRRLFARDRVGRLRDCMRRARLRA
jgi:hypothetical protein